MTALCMLCGGPGVPEICDSCRREYRCRDCDGDGEVYVCRNDRGEVDYLNGKPTDELTPCHRCGGEGLVL